MTKPLDKHAQSILDELGFNPDDCLWDCRGTWVMLHKYIELAGVQKGITMDSLDVVESNAEKGIAVIKCVASKGDIKVTSFGEVNPKNNRNSYPMAMAEKRAIDRAYLKLLGLHGFIYSEEEMKLTDEDKEELPKKKSKRIVSPDRDYIIFDEEENEENYEIDWRQQTCIRLELWLCSRRHKNIWGSSILEFTDIKRQYLVWCLG